MENMSKLIVALDTKSIDQAVQWTSEVKPHSGMVKIGLEYYFTNGIPGIQAIDMPKFLDLKLHDIPDTVYRACQAILPLHCQMLTVHASGGTEMITAARKAADQAQRWSSDKTRCLIIAVTVLTSFDQDNLKSIGVSTEISNQVFDLTKLALDAGADGVVCSPQECLMLREKLGNGPVIVVAGIRPDGVAFNSQKRTMTPQEASKIGANWYVVGRPITYSVHPGIAASEIAQSLNAT